MPVRHEDARDGVELRSAAGILLAAVVPDDRREPVTGPSGLNRNPVSVRPWLVNAMRCFAGAGA